MEEGVSELSGVSVMRTLIPFMGAPLSWPSHFPKAPMALRGEAELQLSVGAPSLSPWAGVYLAPSTREVGPPFETRSLVAPRALALWSFDGGGSPEEL